MNMRPHGWHHHPGVRSGDQLTRGERAADRMRNGMGSWGFVFGALVFLAVWMGLNAAMAAGAFDAYPYILLNLVLSCVAALQGAILLIAAKRSDQVSSELAQHDYATNVDALGKQEVALEKLETVTGNVVQIQEHLTAQDEKLAAVVDRLETVAAHLTVPGPGS